MRLLADADSLDLLDYQFSTLPVLPQEPALLEQSYQQIRAVLPHAGRLLPTQPDPVSSSGMFIHTELSPLQRLRLEMCKHDTPNLATSLAPHDARNAIRHAAVCSATSESKTPPIVFC